MNKELIICVGSSGSGKSTWTISYIEKNPNFIRINRDSIRESIFGSLIYYYVSKDINYREKLVTELETSIFNLGFLNSSNIIIDNTNLKQSYVNRWIQLSQDTNYSIKFKLFDIGLEKSKERVLERDFRMADIYTVQDGLKYHQGELAYIDKQFKQYQEIKKYLETYHKSQII